MQIDWTVEDVEGRAMQSLSWHCRGSCHGPQCIYVPDKTLWLQHLSFSSASAVSVVLEDRDAEASHTRNQYGVWFCQADQEYMWVLPT